MDMLTSSQETMRFQHTCCGPSAIAAWWGVTRTAQLPAIDWTVPRGVQQYNRQTCEVHRHVQHNTQKVLISWSGNVGRSPHQALVDVHDGPPCLKHQGNFTSGSSETLAGCAETPPLSVTESAAFIWD
jgi:hypothetical protein